MSYLPFLVFMTAGWFGLLLLCCLAMFARRSTKLSRRLLLGLPPVILGLFGVFARIPLECRVGDFRATLDLGWLFVVPLIFGLVGLFGARHEAAA
jgi:hypothetical protein